MNITTRFSSAPWFSQANTDVFIGGAGGIGSWLAFFLCRAGFLPFIQDFDLVEEHNLGGQLFTTNDIGNTKVGAVEDMCMIFAGKIPNIANRRITEDSSSIVKMPFTFSAFDNMTARKLTYNHWKNYVTALNYDGPEPIFIDGRLSAEQLQIFCVTRENMAKYETSLFDDSLIPDAPCTFKQTSHVAAIIAGLMTSYFTNHISNIKFGEVIREVPFFYEMTLPFNLIKEDYHVRV